MRIVEHSATLVAFTPNPEKVIEQAGRLCYKSEDRITEDSHVKFIQMLLDPKKAHESVLEHATATFVIGTDRGITHEIVRHRIASYSQTSTRYVNYSKDKFGSEIAVVKPVDLAPDTPAWRMWREAMVAAEHAYMVMLEHGAKPQIARSVLPTCTYTEIAMTANFREWRHFLKLRLAPSAHPDIRAVAALVRDELLKIAPTVFAEFAPIPQKWGCHCDLDVEGGDVPDECYIDTGHPQDCSLSHSGQVKCKTECPHWKPYTPKS